MQTTVEVRLALRQGGPVRSLAALVRLAIEDGRQMLADGKVRPDFRWFIMRHEGRVCSACLAGGVMFGTLRMTGEIAPEGYADLFDLFPERTAFALLALDAVRRGQLVLAYRRIHDGDDDDRHKPTPIEEAVQGYERVKAGGSVTHSGFIGPDAFRKHLASLEGLAADLEQLEDAVGYDGPPRPTSYTLHPDGHRVIGHAPEATP
ncbi:MAG: hypothetical protein OXU74_06605 [Gemmatimonadota bacterium]|nr:hypothetical protein [Gemmatimonadota bacterium]